MLARILALLALAATAQAATPHHAVLETTMGDIVVELDALKAPKSVAAFAAFARAGTYDGTIFHRAAKDFVVAGGEIRARAGETPGTPVVPAAKVAPFAAEVRSGLSNRRGTIAFARTEVTGSGRPPHGFFFNVGDNDFLDWRRFDTAMRVPTPNGPQVVPAGTEIPGYAVFGRVVGGLDVLERIAAVPVTAAHPPHEQLPVTPVILKRVKLLAAPR